VKEDDRFRREESGGSQLQRTPVPAQEKRRKKPKGMECGEEKEASKEVLNKTEKGEVNLPD